MKKLKNDIKWISLQPLTGGMYLGFANAIGHDAECIISYAGLNDHKEGKIKGSRGHSGNEYNLTNYLRKHNRIVPRYEFDEQKMFDMKNINEVIVKSDSFTEDIPVSFDDIDIVCSVPVCSGLSALTTTDSDDKETKNCNMKFLAEYALTVIKPKIYIFENAPGFMSAKGDVLRNWFETFASTHGYSVTYFKTDTKYHYNCQRRPRTFVMFVKWTEDGLWERSPETPFWEDEQLNIKEMLNSIPSDATLQDSLPVDLYENVTTMEYAKEKWPDKWRDMFQGDVVNKIIRMNMLDDFRDWCDARTGKFYQRMVKHIDHIEESLANGKGWWSATPRYYPEQMAAVQSRTIYATIHPTEDRLCSERDMMTFMGLPYDFEMQGEFMSDGPKIGQNVPVKTAEWIANIAIKTLDMIDDERELYIPAETPHQGARFYDNTIKKVVY